MTITELVSGSLNSGSEGEQKAREHIKPEVPTCATKEWGGGREEIMKRENCPFTQEHETVKAKTTRGQTRFNTSKSSNRCTQ